MTIPPVGGWHLFSKAPNSVLIICATLVVVAGLASLTAVAIVGGNAEEITRFINTVLNTLGFLAGVGALGFSASASKRADEAANGVNGQLDKKIEDAMTRVLSAKE
jgi:hypothetical protein